MAFETESRLSNLVENDDVTGGRDILSEMLVESSLASTARLNTVGPLEQTSTAIVDTTKSGKDQSSTAYQDLQVRKSGVNLATGNASEGNAVGEVAGSVLLYGAPSLAARGGVKAMTGFAKKTIDSIRVGVGGTATKSKIIGEALKGADNFVDKSLEVMAKGPEAFAGAIAGEFVSATAYDAREVSRDTKGNFQFKITPESTLKAFVANAGMGVAMDVIIRGGETSVRQAGLATKKKNYNDANSANVLNLNGDDAFAINEAYKNTVPSGDAFVESTNLDGEKGYGAFVQGDRFMIKTHKLGKIVGEMKIDQATGEYSLVVDPKKSNMSNTAMQMKFNGKNLLDITDRTFVNAPSQTASPYTMGEYKVDNNAVERVEAEGGTFQATDEAGKLQELQTKVDDLVQNGTDTGFGKEFNDQFIANDSKANMPEGTDATVLATQLVDGTVDASTHPELASVAEEVNSAVNDINSNVDTRANVITLAAKIKKILSTDHAGNLSPMNKFLYNSTETKDPVTGETTTTGRYKKQIVEDLQRAIETALRTGETLPGRDGNSYYTADGKKSLAGKAVSILLDSFYNYGESGLVTDSTKTELIQLAQEVINKRLQQNGTQSNFVDNNGKQITNTISEFDSEFNKNWDKASQQLKLDKNANKTHIVNDGSTRTPKIKDGSLGNNVELRTLAEQESTLVFKWNDDVADWYDDIAEVINDDLLLLQLLRKSDAGRISEGMKVESIGDLASFRRSWEALNDMKSRLENNGKGINFDAEIQSSLRVRYLSEFTPHSSKLIRTFFTPVTTQHAVHNFDAKTMEMAKRSILGLIDAKHNGEPVANISDPAIIDGMFERAYAANLSRSRQDILFESVDAEGLHSLHGFVQLQKLGSWLFNGKQGDLNMRILTEVDGKNQGPAILRALFGNFDQKGLGIGSEDGLLSGADHYNSVREKMVQVLADEGSLSTVAKLLGDENGQITKMVVKYGMIPLDYGAQSDSLKLHLAKAFLEDIMKDINSGDSQAKINAIQSMIDTAQVDQAAIQHIQNLEQTVRDLTQDKRDAAGDKVAQDNIQSTIDETTRQISELKESGVNSKFNPDVVRAFRKLLADREATARSDAYQARANGNDLPNVDLNDLEFQDYDGYVMTALEKESLLKFIGEDTADFVDKTFGNVYQENGSIMNETKAFVEANQLLTDISREMQVEFAIGLHKVDVPTKGLAKTIAQLLVDQDGSGRLNKSDLETALSKEFNKKDMMSIMQINQIILDNGANPYKLVNTWQPMIDASVSISNYDGQTIALVNEDSNLGLVTGEQGQNLNVKTISFIENFLPLLAIGQDASFMSNSLGKNSLSLFDAQFGDFLEVIGGAKEMNNQFAKMSLNYNVVSELKVELQRLRNRNVGAVVDEKVIDTVTRFQTTPDTPAEGFMETRDQVAQQIQERSESTESSKLNDRMEETEVAINDAQNTQGSLNVSNVTIGMADSQGSYSKLSENWSVDKNSMQGKTQSLDFDLYSSVKSVDKPVTNAFKFMGISQNLGHNSSNITVVVGNTTNFDPATGILEINTSNPDAAGIAKMIHEIAHKASFSIQTSDIDFGNVGKIVDLINSGRIPLRTINANDGSVGTYSNSATENYINLFESLLFNELIMANKDTFAAKLAADPTSGVIKNPDGTYDMSKLIQKRYVEIDGQRIYTIQSLQNFLKLSEKDSMLDLQMENMYNATFGTLNSSISIQDWFNGKAVEEFQGSRENNPLFTSSAYDTATTGTLAEFKENLITTQSTLSLFSIDKQVEAMNAIGGRAKKADADIQKHAADHLDAIYKTIVDIADGKMDVKEVDDKMGALMGAGLHHLIDKYQSGMTYESFMKELSRTLDLRVGKNEVMIDFINQILSDSNMTMKESDVKRIATEARKRVFSLSNSSSRFKGNHNSLDVTNYILQEIDKIGLNSDGVTNEGLQKLSNGEIISIQRKPMIDKFIAYHRMIKNTTGSKHTKADGGGYLKQAFNQLVAQSSPAVRQKLIESAQVWMKTEDRLMTSNLYENQFGTNAKPIFKNEKYRLSMTGTPAQRAGTINVQGTQVPVYIIESKDIYVMEQDSVFIDVSVSDFEKGIANINLGKVIDGPDGPYVEIGGEQVPVNASQSGNDIKARISLDSLARKNTSGKKILDTSFSSMLQRNMNLITGDDIKKVALDDQIRVALQSGLLKTAEYYNQNPELQDTMQIMGNPMDAEGSELYASSVSKFIAKKYGKLYYQDRFRADVEGTKGANIGKALDENFGPGASKVMREMIQGVIGLRDIFKTSLLILNPGSWVNSVVGSMGVYMVHAKGASMFQDRAAAYRIMDEYEAAMNVLSSAYLKGDATEIANAKTALESTEMHAASLAGISSTIRSDAAKAGTYGSNPFYRLLDKYTGGTGASSSMKALHFDPSTKHGASAGTYFDKTELMPKMMLYVNMKNNGMTDTQAAQYTTMANPQYNRNLPGIWNLIDQVSPYTKYFISYPTMLNFAWSTNKSKLLGITGGQQALFAATWMFEDELSEEEKRLMWSGYVNLPGDTAKYGPSMSNYIPPFINPVGKYSVDPMFVPDLVSEGHAFVPIRTGIKWGVE